MAQRIGGIVTRTLRIIRGVVVAELLLAAAWCLPRLMRPAFPVHNPVLLDPMTSASIERLRSRLNVDDAAAWGKLGEAYLIFGSYRQAEGCYRRAGELRSGDVDFAFGRGLCLERLGRTSEAIALFREIAPRATPQLQSEVVYRIGRNQLREEDTIAAEQAFLDAAGFPPADQQRAKLMIRSGRAAEALTLVTSLTAAGPDVLEVNQLAERVFRALGDEERAREYRERLERSPNRLATARTASAFRVARRQYGAARRLAEADALETSGHTADALRVFQEVLQVDPTELLAIKVAALQVRLGQPEQGVETCRQQAARGGASAALLETMGAAHSALGEHDEAVALWERAATLALRPGVCRALAEAYDRRGDKLQARRQRALAEAAEGIEDYRRNRISQARERLASAIRQNPDHAAAWYYLGCVQQLEEDRTSAVESFERCLALDAGHGRAFAALAALRH